jgi:hypothetical protein
MTFDNTAEARIGELQVKYRVRKISQLWHLRVILSDCLHNKITFFFSNIVCNIFIGYKIIKIIRTLLLLLLYFS